MNEYADSHATEARIELQTPGVWLVRLAMLFLEARNANALGDHTAYRVALEMLANCACDALDTHDRAGAGLPTDHRSLIPDP